MNAEQSLVGAAIRDPKVFHEAALQYSHFSDPICQVAWKALGKCIEANIEVDEITVSDATNGKLSASQLSALTTSTGIVNTAHWADIVRDGFVQRGVSLLSSNFQKWSTDGMSGPEMLTRVQAQIEVLENSNARTLPTLASLSISECSRIRSTPHERLRGLPTGLGIGRVAPGGISRGNVTTLFGETGNYKTTTKNNILLGIARSGFKVLDVSLEDANELTAHRFIAGCTGLNYGKIAAGDLSASDKAKLELQERHTKAAENVILAGEILPNIDEIIRTARYYAQKHELAAVCIDYVQLLESRNPRQTERELLNEIMRKCQLAAKRDNIAYIIVSQVKQDVDQRTDHRPRITDMIGSSAMRTASKLSIGVYRPSLYHTTPPKGSGYEYLFSNHPRGEEIYENMLELHFLKNVLGAPKVVVHCNVNPGTGHMEPFDMLAWKK